MYSWDRTSGSRLGTPCSLMLPRSREDIALVPLLLQIDVREGGLPHKRQLLDSVARSTCRSPLKRLLQTLERCEKQGTCQSWRASTQHLPIPSAPKCCNCTQMAIVIICLHAQLKNILQSAVVREGHFSSLVNECSQHNVVLEWFFKQCELFLLLLLWPHSWKHSQWKILSENQTSSSTCPFPHLAEKITVN